MICSACNNDAVTFIRYNGRYLCEKHFKAYVEKRVHKDMRKQKLLPGVVAVALSGGKDSLTALYLMNDIVAQHRDKELHAITVDEGIKGYRAHTIEVAGKHCQKLEIPHHVISFQETMGLTLDNISSESNELGECTYCGVLRRQCLNRKAKEIGAHTLVLGHNLDDVAQSILMNFVNNELERMARMAPHIHVQPGLIPRILPLLSIPEKEVTLYALLRGLEVLEDECPFAVRASRGLYREWLSKLEDSRPGTRHSILQSYLTLACCLEELFPSAQLRFCSRCNEPSSQNTCRACTLLEPILVDEKRIIEK